MPTGEKGQLLSVVESDSASSEASRSARGGGSAERTHSEGRCLMSFWKAYCSPSLGTRGTVLERVRLSLPFCS